LLICGLSELSVANYQNNPNQSNDDLIDTTSLPSFPQAEDGDLEDDDDDEDDMLLPPRRRLLERHEEEEEEEAEEEEEEAERARLPQASVLYQDLLMSDGEDDASEEEGDNPFSCRSRPLPVSPGPQPLTSC